MAAKNRSSLKEYLVLEYSFRVTADPDGGYVIEFPDLPGCMTQVDDLEKLGRTAEEIRTLWIETEYEAGRTIPLPTQPPEYSGKFNLRIPRSVHRRLAESAEREGVSLNQYVVTLLSERDVGARVESRLALLERKLDALQAGLQFEVSGVPAGPRDQTMLRLVKYESLAA